MGLILRLSPLPAYRRLYKRRQSMELEITVSVDTDQIKGREQQLKDDIQFAIAGALNMYRDGKSRHSCVIDYEIIVKEK